MNHTFYQDLARQLPLLAKMCLKKENFEIISEQGPVRFIGQHIHNCLIEFEGTEVIIRFSLTLSYLEALCMMAHELGHYINWLEGKRTDDVLKEEGRASLRALELLSYTLGRDKWLMAREELVRAYESYK